MTAAGRIPVLVVGGFLGSGKTSLLRHMLTGADDTAVIVNEFGTVGLDHHLLRACEERVELVGGGCACCTRRQDLVSALAAFLDDRDRGRVPVARVVIETSGLADPAPIVFTITNDPMLRHHFEVQRLLVTVDAVAGNDQLAAHPEVAKQALVADELVITKVDLVEPKATAALAQRLRSLNPAATIRAAIQGVVEDQPIRVAAGDSSAVDDRPPPSRPGGEDPRHTDDVRSLQLSPQGSIDWLGFSVWLSMLLHARGEEVLRVKGLLELDDRTLVSVNGVQHVVHAPEHLSPSAIPDPSPSLVFITRGLDPSRLRESLDVFQSLARTGDRHRTG